MAVSIAEKNVAVDILYNLCCADGLSVGFIVNFGPIKNNLPSIRIAKSSTNQEPGTIFSMNLTH